MFKDILCYKIYKLYHLIYHLIYLFHFILQSKSLDTSVLFSPASMALEDSFLTAGTSPIKVENVHTQTYIQTQPALSWYYSRTNRL